MGVTQDLTGKQFNYWTVLHKFKNEWAAAHNIPLVRIPYTERDNITLDMLLGDRFLVKGGD